MDYLKDFKLTSVGTCQRHVRPDHPGGHVLDEPEADSIKQKVFPREKTLPISSQIEIVSVNFNDTG